MNNQQRRLPVSFFVVVAIGFVAIWSSNDPSAVRMPGARLHGLSIWIWILKNAEGGKVESMIKRCRDVGIKAVLIKVNDGREVITLDGRCEPVENVEAAPCQLTRELVDSFHANGVAVHGWGMMYGGDCQKEIDFAIHAIHTLGADGFVFDTEGYIKGKPSEAEEICRGVREHIKTCTACHGKLLGFSPYRNPEGHRSLPYEVFERYCDVMLPQVYYWYPHSRADPGKKLDQSFAQWLRLERRVHGNGEACAHQIIPVGQTMYNTPPEKITAMMAAAQDYKGHSVWKWEDTSEAQWQALKEGPIHSCTRSCR